MSPNYIINSQYVLPGPVQPSCTGFESIWKVEADSRYCSVQSDGLPGHSVFLTLEGCGTISLPGLQRSEYLSGSTLFFLPADTSCSYRCEKQDHWKFFFISFSEQILINELKYPRLKVIDNIHGFIVKEYCNLIINTIVDKRDGYLRESDLLFQQLLIYMKRDRESLETECEKRITALIRWIHNNQHSAQTIEEILSFTNLSRSVLFRMFKERTGKSPGQYVRDLKLENARNLLQHTELKIWEIASNIGFYDEFYFSKQFKKKNGISPSEFRKRSPR